MKLLLCPFYRLRKLRLTEALDLLEVRTLLKSNRAKKKKKKKVTELGLEPRQLPPGP